VCVRGSIEAARRYYPRPMNDVLTDGHLTLRPPAPGDETLHFEAVVESIAEVSRWLEWCHEGYALEESRSWVERAIAGREAGEMHEFFIYDEIGRFCGGCGLNRIDARFLKANLGYWIRTSATGQGVATAATILVARYGFEELGLQRIEIIAALDNVASQRVAAKAGAVRESVLRNGIRFRGANIDAVASSLIPGDLD
jgi:ribosomal-protein-serine acetyltransferase